MTFSASIATDTQLSQTLQLFTHLLFIYISADSDLLSHIFSNGQSACLTFALEGDSLFIPLGSKHTCPLLEGDSVSTFQGCFPYKHFRKLVQSKRQSVPLSLEEVHERSMDSGLPRFSAAAAAASL